MPAGAISSPLTTVRLHTTTTTMSASQNARTQFAIMFHICRSHASPPFCLQAVAKDPHLIRWHTLDFSVLPSSVLQVLNVLQRPLAPVLLSGYLEALDNVHPCISQTACSTISASSSCVASPSATQQLQFLSSLLCGDTWKFILLAYSHLTATIKNGSVVLDACASQPVLLALRHTQYMIQEHVLHDMQVLHGFAVSDHYCYVQSASCMLVHITLLVLHNCSTPCHFS